MPDRDAEAVRRARAAGAIVIGKTRTHEFAWGYDMVADGEPVTRNPHDRERMPGGSSGGSAAALATGAAPLALGSDTGGSIRLPAAWCRVVGHKPTFGLVPRDGLWPLAPSLDHAGPMATTPQDAALLLQRARRDRRRRRSPTASAWRARTSFPTARSSPRPTSRSSRPRRWRPTARSGCGRIAPAATRGRCAGNAERAETKELGDAPAQRERLRDHMRRVFEDVDLVVSPVAATGPPRFDEGAVLREIATPYLALQDLSGCPPARCPTGAQVTGRPGEDALVLAYAAELCRT